MPARARLSGLELVMSLPSNRIRPDRDRKRPITLLSSVLLPTPLRPIKQTTSPGPTAKSTSRTISVSPYATESFSIASIDPPERLPFTNQALGGSGKITSSQLHDPVRGTPGSPWDLSGLLLQYLRRGSGLRQGRLPAGRSGARKSYRVR